MNKYTIVIHGGAGPDSTFIKKHQEAYKHALQAAANVGYTILEEGGHAVDAVEAAVNFMENDALFNCGRGSALNEKGEVEMGASIMNGQDLKSGGAAIVRNVKNPVTLARAVMEKSKHIYLGSMGAVEFAKEIGLQFMPDAYFITDHAWEQYASATEEEANSPEQAGNKKVKKKTHGTVGAVALDRQGNVAAATSTGGTENKVPGRIADSSMIGVGTYANNKTCAVSTTGDGEYHIMHATAFHISALVEYKGLTLKQACHHLLHEKLKDVEGDMGLIAIDAQGNFSLEFNCDRMHRAWRSSDGTSGVGIYQKW